MIKARTEYDKTTTVVVPADYDGKSLDDDGVLADVVASGMTEVPGVVENHLRGRYNEVAWALRSTAPTDVPHHGRRARRDRARAARREGEEVNAC